MIARAASILATLALAACKSSSPAAPAAPTATAAPARTSMSFDGLFRAGASWRFRVDSESSFWDDADPKADANGNVVSRGSSETTCKVTETRTFPGGRASQVECDSAAADRFDTVVAGVWIQTAAGLWRGATLPDEGQAPALDPELLFLAADAKPGKNEHKEPESPDGPSGGSGWIDDIEENAGAWCVSRSSWGGDESWQALCIDVDGPKSGNSGWAGGSSQEITFDRIEP